MLRTPLHFTSRLGTMLPMQPGLATMSAVDSALVAVLILLGGPLDSASMTLTSMLFFASNHAR